MKMALRQRRLFIKNLILCFFIITMPDCIYSQNHIKCWDEKDTLIYSDFKAQAINKKDQKTKDGLVSVYWLGNSLNEKYFPLTEKLTNCMDKQESFLIRKDNKYLTLKHEQTHFDISEYFLRKFLDSLSKLTIRTRFVDIDEYEQHQVFVNDFFETTYEFYFDKKTQADENFHAYLEIHGEEKEPEISKHWRDSVLNLEYENGDDFYNTNIQNEKAISRYIDLTNKYSKERNLINEVIKRYNEDLDRFKKRYEGKVPKLGSVKEKNYLYEKKELEKKTKAINQQTYSDKIQRIVEKIVNIKSITNHSQYIQYLKEAENYHSQQKK